MPAPRPPFVDHTTLPRFPAPPATAPPRRSPGIVGLWVLFAVTAAGTLLGPVVAVVAYDLAPLYPLTLVLGAAVGATYGLVAGILLGGLTALVVAATRST